MNSPSLDRALAALDDMAASRSRRSDEQWSAGQRVAAVALGEQAAGLRLAVDYLREYLALPRPGAVLTNVERD